MFKKATKLLSTMVIVAGTVVGNFSPTLALAEGVVKAGDTEGMTNTVKVKDDSLADCKRILEGQAAFPVQAGETEPVDLVVVEDASGSFSDNFPHVRQAIDEVVQGLSDQDRVMLTSYRGGKQFMFPDGKVKINSADYDMNVRVDTQLTHDKSQFVSGFGDVRTYGGTPTASGLKLALDTYNQTHGDLTNRKTYFLLVTDGVANTRLDGYLHKTNTNDSINEYPDPRHPFQVSVEYSNDYQGAAAEVLALNQEITNQGYEMINAYWESVESLSSVNSYFDKYKTEVGPFVKQELQQGSSTPEDFITSQSIDDFTTQLKQIVKDRLAQSTPATASLTIANQFDIQSATATDDAGNDVPVQINGQTISATSTEGYVGNITIHYEVKEELAPYIEQGGITNQADLNFGNEGDVLHSNKPTVTPPAPTPEDPTITKDIENQEHLDLTNREDSFDWHVKTAFGNETSTWQQASLVDDINQLLDIQKVVVTDENGKDVTANGKVTQENNKVTFTMNKKDDSYDYLSGHTYTMTITTKIKADATDEELAPYIQQGGIPNQADLNFGNEGDVLHSNKPTVTPPAPTPEDPTITKDIEGQEHLDLTNRNQAFKWNVKTAFGNETSTWTQASMVDDINKVLDITDVKVTDENGKDVTDNGIVTQENNKVTFTMNKKDDSYSYLAGHTYTMTITTKIKTDATDEELAPYIEQGGIPNQADLNFGNEGDVLHSNKPTVTPPAPTPEDPKKPEPKQPLKPKKPLTPTNHQAPTNPVNFGKSASKGIHLPMTNTTVNPLYMIAGLIVLIVAISFGITKNKKRKN